MKISKYKSVILSGLILLGLGSCTDEFEELNRDKKNPEEVNSEFLVPNVEHNMAYRIANSLSVNDNISSILCQHVSKVEYIEPTQWRVREGLRINHFTNAYTQLQELNQVINDVNEINDLESEKLSKNEKLLLLRTLSSYSWQMLTDGFGPSPYFEALDVLNIQPKYDTQQEIYLEELDKLTTALKNARKVGDAFGKQDIIYNGDAAKWRKFAASQLLRMAMRIADVDKANSVKYANIAIEEGLFESNADNALFQFLPESGKWNPVYAGFREAFSECASNTMIDILKSNSDPRMETFWSPNKDGEYLGNGFGVKDLTEGKFSLFNTETMYDSGKSEEGKLDLPFIFMSYSEVEFFLAEAVVRGGYNVTGTAKSHFSAGVEASLNYWNVEAAKTVAYVTAAESRFDSASKKMDVVATEKWVALISQGVEAWAEVRRLDAPQMNAPVGMPISSFPTRLEFSPNEYSFNKANVKAAAAAIGGDKQTTKLWWDVK